MSICTDVGSFIESKTTVVQTSNVGFTSKVSDYLVVHMGPYDLYSFNWSKQTNKKPNQTTATKCVACRNHLCVLMIRKCLVKHIDIFCILGTQMLLISVSCTKTILSLIWNLPLEQLNTALLIFKFEWIRANCYWMITKWKLFRFFRQIVLKHFLTFCL